MRFMMIILTSIFVIHSVSYSTQTLEVLGLDGETCWIREIWSSEWKIASFGMDDNTGFINKEIALNINFHPELKKRLKSLNFKSYPETNYDVYIHCGAAGAYVVFDMKQHETPICVWTQLKGSSLKIENIYSNHEEKVPGLPCYGNVPGRLNLYIREDSDPGLILNHILSNHSNVIWKVEFSPPQSVYLDLKNRFRYRENLAKSTLESDTVLMKMLESVGYDGISVFVGEGKLLLNHVFPGY